MFTNLGNIKRLWAITACFSLIASVIGVFNDSIYDDIMSEDIIPGAVAQDLVTLLISIIVLFLIYQLNENDHKSQILLLGSMGFYFYAYGIYVIEQVYNWYYLLYLTIFSLSFYSIFYSLYQLDRDLVKRSRLDDRVRKYSLIYLGLNPVVFYPLWLSQLIPLLQSGDRIEYLFSIYIIDLAIIMPAFLIIFYQTYNHNGFGYIIAPAIYVVGFGILIPLSIGEVLKPLFYDLTMDAFSFVLFLILSSIFLVLTYLQLENLEFGE